MPQERRKFFDLHATNKSQIAQKALHCIAALYEVRREARELGSGDPAANTARKSNADYRCTSYLDDCPEVACA